MRSFTSFISVYACIPMTTGVLSPTFPVTCFCIFDYPFEKLFDLHLITKKDAHFLWPTRYPFYPLRNTFTNLNMTFDIDVKFYWPLGKGGAHFFSLRNTSTNLNMKFLSLCCASSAASLCCCSNLIKNCSCRCNISLNNSI